ncbi:MAG: GNAT family N-acetyltransferase [Clostridia bacterium]|nr:GNAT family N-acetyltransferase [Clostridia bacterium]
MIEKVIHPDVLSGVSSPLLPLIYVDFEFNSTETDGVFIQKDDQNIITALFSLKNGCATLTVSDGSADYEELKEFFSFLSVEVCLSDAGDFCDGFKALPLLTCAAKRWAESDVLKLDEYSRLSDYKAVYGLLTENGDNFPQWFSVTSKKINSKKSVAVYKCADGIPVSTAVAAAVYNNIAVISGVFTLETHRKKGYASQCVKALLNDLDNMGVRSVHLWCEENKLPFYRKLGFEEFGKVFVREVF